MVVREPQYAVEYDNRTTAAVKSVLVEIAQILGSFEGKFAVQWQQEVFGQFDAWLRELSLR